MVAPGHCSPSRNVVSKMTTRSLSDWVLEVIGLVLLVECAAHGRFMGCSFRRSPECPGVKCPAGPQGRIRRRSVPRMREAAGPACAARSIAQIFWRVDICLRTLVFDG